MAGGSREGEEILRLATLASESIFQRAIILFDADGSRLISGPAAMAVCASRAGIDQHDIDGLLLVLRRTEPSLTQSLSDLAEFGVAFDCCVSTQNGDIDVRGGVAGVLVLLSLSPRHASRPASVRTITHDAVLGRQIFAQDLILGAVADGVAFFDTDRRLTYFNPAFARLWGLEPAWLLEGPSHGALLDRLRQNRRLPEAADYALFKAQELARHERIDPAPEAVWRVADERTLRVLSLPNPMGGLILMVSDITPELRLSSQFNQLVQVQRATLDKLSDAVAVFDGNARLKLYNEAFQTLWSIPTKALASSPEFDDVVDWCVRRLHDMAFWRALKGRITDPDPGVRAAAQGEVMTSEGRWVAWQSRPLPDGATLVSFLDVTDARNLEAALAERGAALANAERMKREFVSSVSYELRTPLTTVLGYAELLSDFPSFPPQQTRQWIAAVRKAASDLARSVEDILTFAHIDAGEMGLDLGEVEIIALLEAARLRWMDIAADRQVDLVVVTGDHPGRIIADGSYLARSLDHLVSHALGQTPAGGCVTLSARRGFGEVCLEVSDTGPGIPFHIQARLFDRFSGQEGAVAGLGLALVKTLITLHGGWVAVESVPGAGARFTCHLPETAHGPAALG